MRLLKAIAPIFRMGVLLDKDRTIRGYDESNTSVTLRVPYIYQEHVNLCTDASAMMILSAWGYTPKRTTKRNPRGAFEGSSIAAHTDLYEYGPLTWSAANVYKDMTLANFLALLRFRGPLGVENNGHAQVLIGVNGKDNTVILHDPWKGPNKVNTFKKFMKEMVRYTFLTKVGTRVLTNTPPSGKPAWKF